MSTDDVIEIGQLVGRYNQAVDAGDGEAMAATFTEDGVVVGGPERLEGRAALAEFGSAVPGQFPGLRHWVNNAVVDVDGDTATATTYLLMVVAGSPPTLAGSGVYRDTLRRTADGWRFTERSYTLDS